MRAGQSLGKAFLVLTFFAATLAPAWQQGACAQTVDESVVTAALGVPAEEAAGSDPLVYLTWWPTGDAIWEPATYAVYSKSGEPSDPGGFSLDALVRPQTSALAVGQSINQAVQLGEDPLELSSNIDGLYDNIVPVAGLELNQKLAAIVDVSRVDNKSAETLSLLTRRHPAAALAAGVAFVEPIGEGEVRTYEIRSCPDGSSDPAECTVVSGRVVVTGGEVKLLPAPGQPVEVPFVDNSGKEDPRGNLNVPLRWGTPGDLRERSFFQFGYNVYRVDPEFAEDAGWDAAEPDPEKFFGLMSERPGSIIRVNERPILTDKIFSPTEAPDLNADSETYFVIDDNDRYRNGGTPFSDGDRFYYFVAGRDLLGRPGAVSQGTPVTICFRIPPQAPKGLEVSNHFIYDESTETQTQVLKLDWEPAQTREHGPDISEYWIYRWASIEQMHNNQGLPEQGLPSGEITGGRIATVGSDITEYIDDSGVHPFITYQNRDLTTPATGDSAEANKTYWYTVRAVDASACGGNVSGNSGPGYGVLRDRVGPQAPDGSVTGSCLLPIVSKNGSTVEAGSGFEAGYIYLDLFIERIDPRIEWVEFYVVPTDDERGYLGRFDFPETGTLQIQPVLPNSLFQGQEANTGTILVRVGIAGGKRSSFAEQTFSVGLNPDKQSGNYVQAFDFLAATDPEAPCTTHEPRQPGTPATGTIDPVDLDLFLTPDTREWKLYRRVDDGPLTMIEQGIANYNETPNVQTQDRDLPLNGGRVCYFLQVYDLQGNPSVLSRLDCITVEPRTDLPKPMLSPVEPVGETPDNGAARIKWFAPPAGVERFELAIRSVDGVPRADLSDDFRLNVPASGPAGNPFVSLIQVGDKVFRSYLTGRVGANFDVGPSYQALWSRNFASGTEYAFRVRAIGAGGAEGPWSNEVFFIWSSEVDFSQPFDPSDCVVPWPVRGTPDIDGTFPVEAPDRPYPVGLKAAIDPMNPDGSTAYHGGAVRVGFVELGQLDINFSSNWDQPPKGYDTAAGIFPLPRSPKAEKSDLETAFYVRASNGEPLPDFMLYRYQEPNATWANVSGDVYQVSPLIEGLASAPSTFQEQPVWAVHDPYVFLIPEPTVNNGYHLWVKDTQPVIQGASYRYLLVRFTERGEIARVIPLDSVTAN
ncbi:hypothetical protein [Coraliomargarita sinensis]|uniref:hypothetical protein n=1 Tax=Coraliomargarita sinensis TaxID=2174842 RepID=UPI0011B6DF65|nr:hypothetical protein [Coraliomargarita sinensis]